MESYQAPPQVLSELLDDGGGALMNSFAASSQDTKKYLAVGFSGLPVDHVVQGTYLCGIFAFTQVTLENYMNTRQKHADT